MISKSDTFKQHHLRINLRAYSKINLYKQDLYEKSQNYPDVIDMFCKFKSSNHNDILKSAA